MDPLDQIAVVGMACRFAGVANPDELWRVVRDGRETITFFSDEELLANGVPRAALADPAYVKAGGVVDGVELFDAEFFGFTPREAELMDPQLRLFLEVAWEACEHAGYNPHGYPGRVGVYGGSAATSYFIHNLLGAPERLAEAGGLTVKLLNDKDFLTTHVSYKLNLRGPSVAVQTACSTGLVAIHLACQAVLNGECEMALAGGTTLSFPHRTGYLYQEGGIGSPDGHCRAFDERALGTVAGHGAAIVLLKRLADALVDGDTVHAVIRGSAINNDGSQKAGYTAPSVESQTQVIGEALAIAQVEPDSIGLVEAHGSGTPLGDPIEVESLTRAFRASTRRKGFCALGSIKANIGHTDTAAGVASLLRAVLALGHHQLPPEVNFERPNPRLNLEESPFYVATALADWPAAGGTPRRAAVNSLGIGGTNAHVVLEEAPASPAAAPSRPWQLLVLSARTPVSLDAATANLARWLEERPGLAAGELADAAHTLRAGRKAFRHRRAMVCRDRDEALAALADPARQAAGDTAALGGDNPAVTFLFPGLGDHYAGMGGELYRQEKTFRDAIDRCAALLEPHLGLDLRTVLYPPGFEPPAGFAAARKPDLRHLLAPPPPDEADGPLARTALAHPALFAVEYALARQWMEWGVRPRAMIGYSLGEYVAACLAGVFSLEDALALVAGRARRVDALPAGAMLAVPLPEAELAPLLAADAELSLAAADGPGLTVAGGPPAAIERLESRLAERNVACRRLQTAHAFHSAMMEPVVAECARLAAGLRLAPPKIPFVSNVTGTWISDSQATDPAYWAAHLRCTVRFAEGLEALWKGGSGAGSEPRLLLEVGPGQGLGTLARQHPGRPAGQVVVAALRDRRDEVSDQAFLLAALGRLWAAGANPDWSGFAAREKRRRVPLPTYAFDRRRYFVDPADAPPPAAASPRRDLDDWFYEPVWERTSRFSEGAAAAAPERWLLFLDEAGVGERLAARLEPLGHAVVKVRPGKAFESSPGGFTLDPKRAQDYRALLHDLAGRGALPDRIVHLWSVTPAPANGADAAHAPDPAAVEAAEDLGFYSLLWLVQALGEVERQGTVHVRAVANGLAEVVGGERLAPEKATLLGPCRVLPQEVPHATCGAIDVELPAAPGDGERVERLLAELTRAEKPEPLVALRGRHRWVRRFRPARLPAPARDGEALTPRLRKGGVYLVAGGLDETGLTIAEHLFKSAGAKLALLAPDDAPPRHKWGDWLSAHDEENEAAKRMRRVLALEVLGCEVQVLTLDLGQPDQVRGAVERVRERFGALHGVVQAAGESGAGLMQWKTRGMANAVLAPKVRGTLALAAATRDLALDFFVLCGSHIAATGGFGQSDTCAAAAFLDAFAQAAAAGAPGRFVQAIDWGYFRWQPVTAADPALAEQLRAGLAAFGIAAPECVEVFARALAAPLPEVLVSTRDLDEVVAQLDAFSAADFPGAAKRTGEAHPRPDLPTPYAAPRDEMEETIAGIWQEAFGIDKLGIDDNFFDLAGNSLLAIQIVTRIAAAFEVELTIATLLEAPTIAELAGRIAPLLAGAALAAESEESAMDRLLREIEGLSPEEAEARLAQELGALGDASGLAAGAAGAGPA
jgi:acyl transferase domain-containing protein